MQNGSWGRFPSTSHKLVTVIRSVRAARGGVSFEWGGCSPAHPGLSGLSGLLDAGGALNGEGTHQPTQGCQGC